MSPPDAAQGERAVAENRTLRAVVALYTQLSGLATQDTDVPAVISLIAQRLGVGVVVLDADREVHACAGPSADAATEVHKQIKELDLAAVLAASARARRAIALPAAVAGDVALVVAPILVGEEIPAYLFTGARPDTAVAEDLTLLVTEHAAMICGIVVGRQRLVASAVGSARLDLVEALLLARDRTEFELHNWARHLGIDGSRPHVVMTAVLESAKDATAATRAQVGTYVERFLAARLDGAIVARREAEVVAIVAIDGAEASAVDRLMALGRSCRSGALDRYPGVGISVGVGAPCRGTADFARSYAEARLAVDTTIRMTGLGGVVAFRDLGIQRLLSRVTDVADLRAFVTDIFGGLLAHERGNSTEYLKTMAIYFLENNSPKRTAVLMHLHPNTVTYRIRRVEEITGLRLSSYRDRLMIQVALEIVNGLGGLP
ncbi:PucR family transcriptional regulator [Rhizomonospora bruguierae]|uniref:PucR family transcriptional regulator n=1 Tax=Rhizomonospora bruguierae TaxID=1581705 RepID=UPI001BCE3FCB|nr:helix-turn-helix domain-containing protein [Micromonospora sp. NBRC 107566]